MKYMLISVAMIATWATGIMAKDGKDETSNTASTAKAEPDKKEAGWEQNAAPMAEMLVRIKEKDASLYKALVELKKKSPIAFEAAMYEIFKRHHAESDKGKEEKKVQGCYGHKPRPYQNQLDRLP
jgi:hypothetical protein